MGEIEIIEEDNRFAKEHRMTPEEAAKMRVRAEEILGKLGSRPEGAIETIEHVPGGDIPRGLQARHPTRVDKETGEAFRHPPCP